MTDYKQLCAELVDAIDSGIPTDRMHSSPLVLRARAALAEPEPDGPTQRQLILLVDELESRVEHLEALVHELRVGYLRMANAVANQLPDRTKFFADLTPDSDD